MTDSLKKIEQEMRESIHDGWSLYPYVDMRDWADRIAARATPPHVEELK